MDDNRPLKGLFNYKHQIFVSGSKSQDELKALGRFGSDLEATKQRYIAQRGITGNSEAPLITEPIGFDEKKETTTILTLHEAFFLNQALGCLTIHNCLSEVLDVNTCWKEFCAINSKFAIEYAVYFYFKTRHWIVKDGLIYGATFLLYKDGPSLDHAKYAVIIHTNQTWQALLTHYRVIQSVKKELLMVFVKSEVELSLENLRDATIMTRVFSAHPNFMTKILEGITSQTTSVDDWKLLV